MADSGMTKLEQTINELNESLAALKSEIREGHAVLKGLRHERKQIEKLLSTDVKKMVDDQAGEIIKAELDKLGPGIREQTNLIYDKVGIEIDKMLTLCLGKEFATKHGREDLRPALAAKLREFIQEIITEEQL